MQWALFAGAGAGVAVVLAVALVLQHRSGASESRRAHEAAQQREPPVEIGDTDEFGIVDFADHHSGKRVAVDKVEGFVLFANDIPDGLAEGDVVRATVLSLNEGRTSADATVVEPV